MPVTIEMSVSENLDTEEGDVPDAALVQQWAEKACLCDDQVITSVQIVSQDEMRELNNTWRGKNRPTNVLSFPMQSPDEVDLKILGDLALCADVINTEARQQHKPAQAHWAHMVVHGMLHLQGYDHIDEHQASEMEALEIRILDQLGFDNPYLESTLEDTAE
jgi:probable rRNA maturation factor